MCIFIMYVCIYVCVVKWNHGMCVYINIDIIISFIEQNAVSPFKSVMGMI